MSGFCSLLLISLLVLSSSLPLPNDYQSQDKGVEENKDAVLTGVQGDFKDVETGIASGSEFMEKQNRKTSKTLDKGLSAPAKNVAAVGEQAPANASPESDGKSNNTNGKESSHEEGIVEQLGPTDTRSDGYRPENGNFNGFGLQNQGQWGQGGIPFGFPRQYGMSHGSAGFEPFSVGMPPQGGPDHGSGQQGAQPHETQWSRSQNYNVNNNGYGAAPGHNGGYAGSGQKHYG